MVYRLEVVTTIAYIKSKQTGVEKCHLIYSLTNGINRTLTLNWQQILIFLNKDFGHHFEIIVVLPYLIHFILFYLDGV